MTNKKIVKRKQRELKGCAVQGCDLEVYTSFDVPLCEDHKWRRYKNMPHDALIAPDRTARINGGPCSFDGCEGTARTKGLCPAHYRQERLGIELRPIKKATRRHLNSQGYWLVYDPDHPSAQKGGWLMEHRKVMSDYLGRALRKNENVHHINGVRDDNRLENLELWVTSQPSGQRPEDLVAWAEDIISTYKSEMPKYKKLRRIKK